MPPRRSTSKSRTARGTTVATFSDADLRAAVRRRARRPLVRVEPMIRVLIADDQALVRDDLLQIRLR